MKVVGKFLVTRFYYTTPFSVTQPDFPYWDNPASYRKVAQKNHMMATVKSLITTPRFKGRTYGVNYKMTDHRRN